MPGLSDGGGGPLADIRSIQVDLAGGWSAAEFADLFLHLDFIYQLAKLADAPNIYYADLPAAISSTNEVLPSDESYWTTPDVANLAILNGFLRKRFPAGSGLEVQRVKYASPGVVDVAGIGKLAEQVRKFLKDAHDRKGSLERFELEMALKKEELRKARIENAERILKLEKKLKGTEFEKIVLRRLLEADEFIEQKSDRGKIISIE